MKKRLYYIEDKEYPCFHGYAYGGTAKEAKGAFWARYSVRPYKEIFRAFGARKATKQEVLDYIQDMVESEVLN